jgi:multidrug transporter EmrE-like cation transporter
MRATSTHQPRVSRPLVIALGIAVVALTLATAQIHLTLGGWLTRYALIGFTAVTILGWLAFGARFDLAYIDKAIEVVLIGLVLVESWVIDGGPLAVVRRAQRDVAALLS